MNIETIVFAGTPHEAIVNSALKKGIDLIFLPTCKKALDELPKIYRYSTNTVILVSQDFPDDPDGTLKILKTADEQIEYKDKPDNPVVISTIFDNSKLDYHHRFDPRDGLNDLFIRVDYITKKNPKKDSFSHIPIGPKVFW